MPFGDLHIKKPTFVKIKTVKKDEFVVYYDVIYILIMNCALTHYFMYESDTLFRLL